MLNNLPAELKIFYCLYYSLLEQLGGDVADDIFSTADMDPFDQKAPDYYHGGSRLIAKISAQLSELYGPEAARGVLIRMGSASLVFFRKYFSGIAQLGSLENRLKPLDRRFSVSLNKLAEVLSTETGTRQTVQQFTTRQYEWQIHKTGTEASEFEPYFIFGLLEGFCAWLDARKNYLLNYTVLENKEAYKGISLEIRDME